MFHDNKPYCCFEGTRNQQYALFLINFRYMPQSLGYEVNLGSGLESFLYWRSLWALWLTPWEFAGDLGRWNPLHVHRIFLWKKQTPFEWGIDRNRFRDYAVLTDHSHWYLIPNLDKTILCCLTATKVQTKRLKLEAKSSDNSFEFWELKKCYNFCQSYFEDVICR